MKTQLQKAKEARKQAEDNVKKIRQEIEAKTLEEKVIELIKPQKHQNVPLN